MLNEVCDIHVCSRKEYIVTYCAAAVIILRQVPLHTYSGKSTANGHLL